LAFADRSQYYEQFLNVDIISTIDQLSAMARAEFDQPLTVLESQDPVRPQVEGVSESVR
jgi:hypothetical protein